MAKPLKNLRSEMSPAALALSEKRARDLRREIQLAELRGALGVSQEELADLLNKKTGGNLSA